MGQPRSSSCLGLPASPSNACTRRGIFTRAPARRRLAGSRGLAVEDPDCRWPRSSHRSRRRHRGRVSSELDSEHLRRSWREAREDQAGTGHERGHVEPSQEVSNAERRTHGRRTDDDVVGNRAVVLDEDRSTPMILPARSVVVKGRRGRGAVLVVVEQHSIAAAPNDDVGTTRVDAEIQPRDERRERRVERDRADETAAQPAIATIDEAVHDDRRREVALGVRVQRYRVEAKVARQHDEIALLDINSRQRGAIPHRRPKRSVHPRGPRSGRRTPSVNPFPEHRRHRWPSEPPAPPPTGARPNRVFSTCARCPLFDASPTDVRRTTPHHSLYTLRPGACSGSTDSPSGSANGTDRFGYASRATKAQTLPTPTVARWSVATTRLRDPWRSSTSTRGLRTLTESNRRAPDVERERQILALRHQLALDRVRKPAADARSSRLPTRPSGVKPGSLSSTLPC